MTSWLWTLPVVGACVGYATNWLAVRMLFRPRRRTLGLQGLIPKRRAEIASKIAATVERELVRPSDIEAMLSDPELHAAAEREIDLRVREFLARKVDELPALALVVLPVDIEDRLRRSIVKLIIGLVLMSQAVNLLIFTAAGLTRGRPPLIQEGHEGPCTTADPVPQALVLTAIVISFGVLAFAMVLVQRSYKIVGTDDLDRMRGDDR